MNQRESTAGMECPELEEMASYLDNSVSDADRRRLEAHFADCDRCRDLLAEVLRAEAEVRADAAVTVVRRRSWVMWAGGFAAAAVLFLSLWRWNFREVDPVRPELAELVAAVSASDVRPVEARLTGGFPYASAPSAQRAPRTEASVDVQLAALTIQKRAEGNDSPEQAAALGVARLVVGDYDGAIQRLSSAVGRDASLAYAWSDLAAAYLSRGAGDDPVRALDAARRATTAADFPPEAWFNLALACERVGLTDEARRAWNRVIADEQGSPWAEEARQHLTAKGGADGGGGNAPVGYRTQLEEVLLPQWAEAIQSGDRGAQSDALAKASATAALLAQATGDRMFVDVVAALAKATDPVVRDLAAGHRAYARGRVLQERDQVSAAAVSYKEAVDRLTNLTPYGDWATLWWLSLERDAPGAAERLQSIADRARRNSFHNLSGRAQWLIGLRAGLSGDFAASLPAYERASMAFAKSGERDWANSIRVLMGEAHELLGNYDVAWVYRLQALVYAETASIRPSARWALVGGAFRAALRQRLQGAAAVFQDALIALVRTHGTPVTIAQQLIARAKLRTQEGDVAGAIADLDAVDEQLRAMNDQRARTTVGVEVQVERAQLASAPIDRVNALTAALSLVAETQLLYRLPTLYRARAASHAEMGAWSAAADDLAAARAAAAQQRAALTDAQLRFTSSEETWPIFVESARVAVLAGDQTCGMFDLVESGRLETMAARHSTRVATLPDLQRQLGSNAGLVSFVHMRDRTLAWVVTGRRCDLFDLSLPEHAFTAHVEALAAAATKPASDWRSIATVLYDALFAPLSNALQGVRSIVIVPDGVTARIPFALLTDRATGQMLVERYELALSPSVTSWVDAMNRGSTSASVEPRVLAVGNPDRRDAQRSLPDLPFAAIEARDVARLFPDSVLLTGAAATRTNVLAAVASSDILHFAGHAIAHDRLPWMSRLVVASDSPDVAGFASVLGYELQHLRWSRLRLAFLSACSTAGLTQAATAGWFGFATPLLAAGVPTVVVTLWNVNDQQTHAFATAFYRYVRAGLAPASALQRTQMEIIRSSGVAAPPASWAAFVLVGAGDRPLITNHEESNED